MQKITIKTLKKMKSTKEKIACLTSYDGSFAKIQDETGVDVLLVGDSLGMVLHGDETTLNVTMSNMIYHTRLVTNNCHRALVISDMPYKSYTSPAQALENARRLAHESNTDMVKMEGGKEISEAVASITQDGIPVCGHLGLMPQSIHKLGGYRVQAKTEAEANKLKEDAILLQVSGADCLVLECVPAKVAADISSLLDIPVIGIGAGVGCDGQVLVVYDILGLSEQKFKFSKNFLSGRDSISDAIKAYVAAVKNNSFPSLSHSYE
ncbi:3-methyl-2-oxobutanoate hydroxymethyltransferase [Gammaproteobacteria bacterium]|nr:3-methyl-2-oxobutanoate hydroxymethyltransferase [Gammaproteobacteria bacterium]MDB9800083.1 3-methyl-2-oxobutanoate hydroxymethyltransferase [bacterium]